METKYLMRHSLKMPGWILFVVGIIIGACCLFFNHFFDIKINVPVLYNDMPFGNGPLGSNPENGWFKMVNDSITDELAGVLIIIGALFIAFSKEKIEDEFVMKIRLESLVWAIIVNSLILLICLLAFYGFSFLYVLDINIVSILVLYVIKFRYELWKSEKYEKHT